MKPLYILAVSFLCSTHAFGATADSNNVFSQYAVPIQSITCKNLDFNSNFRAERSKQNIIKTNPNLTQPNFAGKYLLLKNELMMETEWLTADCATGKFLKERIYGQAQFKPDSSLVILFPDPSKVKSDEDADQLPELKIFENEKWTNANIAQPINIPAVTNNSTVAPDAATDNAAKKTTVTIQQYEELFKNYPAPISDLTCKDLDYRSNFKVQNSKESIEKANPDRLHPNFAGKYLLIKNELLFDTDWYLVDCATGKFFPDPISSNNANFRKDSSLILINQSKLPRLITLVDEEWKRIPNPITMKGKKTSNTLYGSIAVQLMKSIPNPNHKSMITFENLQCTKDNSNVTCTIDGDHTKAEKLSEAQANQAFEVVTKWGNNFKISNGRCSSEKKPVTCSIEIE